MSTVTIERIKERVSLLGMSARAVSLKAGLGPDGIRNIYRGKSESPRGKTLVALADVLQCSIAYLAGEDDVPVPQDVSRPAGEEPLDAGAGGGDPRIAKWIVRERDRRRWSQENLAGSLSVDVAEVRRWEEAKAKPSLFQMIDMCGLFGVSVASFLAPGAPYHGRVIEADDELEVLALWRGLEPDERGRILRMLRAAVSPHGIKSDETQLDRKKVDVG